MTGDGVRPGKFENPGAEERCALLKRVKTIAVVGLSPNPGRPSYGVSKAMQEFGYTIIPVHPVAREILGAKAYCRLADIPFPIDLVNVFRNSADVPPVVDEAIKIGAKVVWMQEGIVNEEAAKTARAAGLQVVMNACMRATHRRLIGPKPVNLLGIHR